MNRHSSGPKHVHLLQTLQYSSQHRIGSDTLYKQSGKMPKRLITSAQSLMMHADGITVKSTSAYKELWSYGEMMREA